MRRRYTIVDKRVLGFAKFLLNLIRFHEISRHSRAGLAIAWDTAELDSVLVDLDVLDRRNAIVIREKVNFGTGGAGIGAAREGLELAASGIELCHQIFCRSHDMVVTVSIGL